MVFTTPDLPWVNVTGSSCSPRALQGTPLILPLWHTSTKYSPWPKNLASLYRNLESFCYWFQKLTAYPHSSTNLPLALDGSQWQRTPIRYFWQGLWFRGLQTNYWLDGSLPWKSLILLRSHRWETQAQNSQQEINYTQRWNIHTQLPTL